MKRNQAFLELLKDPDVKRWQTNLSKGSVIVADVYFRALGRFCPSIKMSPRQFISLPQKEIEDLTQDFIDQLERIGKYSPGYIETYLKAIRSLGRME